MPTCASKTTATDPSRSCRALPPPLQVTKQREVVASQVAKQRQVVEAALNKALSELSA